VTSATDLAGSTAQLDAAGVVSAGETALSRTRAQDGAVIADSITDEHIPQRNAKRKARTGSAAEHEEDDSEAVDVDEDDKHLGLEQAPSKAMEGEIDEPKPRESQRRWPIVVAILVFVLAAGGGGAYVSWKNGLFGGKSSEDTSKKTASKSASKSTSKGKSSTSDKKVVEKTDKTEKPTAEVTGDKPASSANAVPTIKLSAAHLAAELATNAEETKRRYAGKRLEVTGLFDKIEATRPPRLNFSTREALVACDIPPKAMQLTRLSMTTGDALTVSGALGADGLLHDCEPQPLTATAEEKYKGKVIEVSGLVETVSADVSAQQFPSIRLAQGTIAIVELECLFKRTEQQELEKLPPGTLVTVKGTCNGRRLTGQRQYSLRLDNCQLVYTTAPEPQMIRLDVMAFLWDYEEDLRPALLPRPDSAEPGSTVTISQLEKEFLKDSKALDKNYKDKMLIVTGRLQGKSPSGSLILETGETSQALQVKCFFSRHNFAEITDRPDAYCIRGLCTGMINAQTLRLDNCEYYNPNTIKDPRRLTAQYLPYKPGENLTYDLALFAGGEKREPIVMRQVFQQRDKGITESLITHQGVLPTGKSLLDASQRGQWVSAKKTKKTLLPGPVYFYRLSGGYVETGQRQLTKDGGTEIVWEPRLKLGSQTGNTWKWSYGNAHHEYKLVKFDENQGRPCAVVQEVVVWNTVPEQHFEINHVYVQHVGELERREIQLLTGRASMVVREMRLVEDLPRQIHSEEKRQAN